MKMSKGKRIDFWALGGGFIAHDTLHQEHEGVATLLHCTITAFIFCRKAASLGYMIDN